jgi:hypothetical protein
MADPPLRIGGAPRVWTRPAPIPALSPVPRPSTDDGRPLTPGQYTEYIVAELTRQRLVKAEVAKARADLELQVGARLYPTLYEFVNVGKKGEWRAALATLPDQAWYLHPEQHAIFHKSAVYKPQLSKLSNGMVHVGPSVKIGPDGVRLVDPNGCTTLIAVSWLSSLLGPALPVDDNGMVRPAFSAFFDAVHVQVLSNPGVVVHVDASGRVLERFPKPPLVQEAVPDGRGVVHLTVRPLLTISDVLGGSSKKGRAAQVDAVPLQGDIKFPVMTLGKKATPKAAGGRTRSEELLVAAAHAGYDMETRNNYRPAPYLVPVPGTPFIPRNDVLAAQAAAAVAMAAAAVGAGTGAGAGEAAAAGVKKRAPARLLTREKQGGEDRKDMAKRRMEKQSGTCERCNVQTEDVWEHLCTAAHADKSKAGVKLLDPIAVAIGGVTVHTAAVARVYGDATNRQLATLGSGLSSANIRGAVARVAETQAADAESWQDKSVPGSGFLRPARTGITTTVILDGHTGVPVAATADATVEDVLVLNPLEPTSEEENEADFQAALALGRDLARALTTTDLRDTGKPHPRLRVRLVEYLPPPPEARHESMATAGPAAVMGTDSGEADCAQWKLIAGATLDLVLRKVKRIDDKIAAQEGAGAGAGGEAAISAPLPDRRPYASLIAQLDTPSAITGVILEAAAHAGAGQLPREMLAAAGWDEAQIADGIAGLRPNRAFPLKVDAEAVSHAKATLMPYVRDLRRRSEEGAASSAAAPAPRFKKEVRRDRAAFEQMVLESVSPFVALSPSMVLLRLGLREDRSSKCFTTQAVGPCVVPTVLQQEYERAVGAIAAEMGLVPGLSVAEYAVMRLEKPAGAGAGAASPSGSISRAAPASARAAAQSLLSAAAADAVVVAAPVAAVTSSPGPAVPVASAVEPVAAAGDAETNAVFVQPELSGDAGISEAAAGPRPAVLSASAPVVSALSLGAFVPVPGADPLKPPQAVSPVALAIKGSGSTRVQGIPIQKPGEVQKARLIAAAAQRGLVDDSMAGPAAAPAARDDEAVQAPVVAVAAPAVAVVAVVATSAAVDEAPHAVFVVEAVHDVLVMAVEAPAEAVVDAAVPNCTEVRMRTRGKGRRDSVLGMPPADTASPEVTPVKGGAETPAQGVAAPLEGAAGAGGHGATTTPAKKCPQCSKRSKSRARASPCSTCSGGVSASEVAPSVVPPSGSGAASAAADAGSPVRARLATSEWSPAMSEVPTESPGGTVKSASTSSPRLFSSLEADEPRRLRSRSGVAASPPSVAAHVTAPLAPRRSQSHSPDMPGGKRGGGSQMVRPDSLLGLRMDGVQVVQPLPSGTRAASRGTVEGAAPAAPAPTAAASRGLRNPTIEAHVPTRLSFGLTEAATGRKRLQPEEAVAPAPGRGPPKRARTSAGTETPAGAPSVAVSPKTSALGKRAPASAPLPAAAPRGVLSDLLAGQQQAPPHPAEDAFDWIRPESPPDAKRARRGEGARPTPGGSVTVGPAAGGRAGGGTGRRGGGGK